MATPDKPKSIDIWLVFVIILMVLAIGGGLFITGKSMSANIDELSVRSTARLQRIENEVFALRKEVQDVKALVRKMVAAKPEPAPAPEPPVVPKKAPAPKAEPKKAEPKK